MAIAARQTHIAVGEDHVIGVERQLLVDPATGRAAEVENVTVAVDMGDGTIGVAKQQRIRGIQTGYGTAQSRQPRAITYPANTAPPRREVNHLLHCILCLICPCWIFVWILACLTAD